jgi:hypothetical protein
MRAVFTCRRSHEDDLSQQDKELCSDLQNINTAYLCSDALNPLLPQNNLDNLDNLDTRRQNRVILLSKLPPAGHRSAGGRETVSRMAGCGWDARLGCFSHNLMISLHNFRRV